MASNYSPMELFGTGSFLKENFTAGVENTICLTKVVIPSSFQADNGDLIDTTRTSSNYLFMHTRAYPDSPLPLYFSGSIFSGSNVYGSQTDNYTQGIYVPAIGGVSEIKWTPAVDIIGADVYFRATGLISASINGNCQPIPYAVYDSAFYDTDIYS